MNTSIYKREAFEHYLICALWSSTGDDGEPLDNKFCPDDIENSVDMREDLYAFIFKNLDELIADNVAAEMCGHDFWLTRNGHGTGFWDRGLINGDKLSEACKIYGECNFYIGDDKKLYYMKG